MFATSRKGMKEKRKGRRKALNPKEAENSL